MIASNTPKTGCLVRQTLTIFLSVDMNIMESNAEGG